MREENSVRFAKRIGSSSLRPYVSVYHQEAADSPRTFYYPTAQTEVRVFSEGTIQSL